MYPHERSLVEKHKDQPFALIGVNSDRDLEKVMPALKEASITWRSFWNGPKGTGGPISSAWNVGAWPTIYLIDAEGVIRFKQVRGEALDAAIEKLLAEMKDARSDSASDSSTDAPTDSPAPAAESKHVVTLDGSIEPVAKKPGQFTVTVQFVIKEGWHTYDVVGEGAEVQTTLEMELPEGVRAIGDWRRPLGVDGKAEGSSVHEGMIEFHRDVIVPAAAGGKEIAVTVNYQACTDEYCNPPKTEIVLVLIPKRGGSDTSPYSPNGRPTP